MKQQWTIGFVTSVIGGLVVALMLVLSSAFLMSDPKIVGIVFGVVIFLLATFTSSYVLTLRKRRQNFATYAHVSTRSRGFTFHWVSLIIGLFMAWLAYHAGIWVWYAAQPDAAVEEVEPGVAFRDCKNCPVVMIVPAGSFSMGSPIGEVGRYANEGPIHPRTIHKTLGVGVYEVTRGQFRDFIEASGYDAGDVCWTFENMRWRERIGRSWESPGYLQDDQHPVVCVNRYDVMQYVEWLSATTDQEYRIPTESEWEYAARAGTKTTYYWDDASSSIQNQCENANGADLRTDFLWRVDCDDRYEFTAPVGSYKPNPFGLHDMLGNVWEWTQDCWSDDYSNATADATAYDEAQCELGVLRGGSRYVSAQGIRAAHRYRFDPTSRNQNTGFRVIRWSRAPTETSTRTEPQKLSSQDDSSPVDADTPNERTTKHDEVINCRTLVSEIEDIPTATVRDINIHEILTVLLKESTMSEEDIRVGRIQCAAQISKMVSSLKERDAAIIRVISANIFVQNCSAARELAGELSTQSTKSTYIEKIAIECLGRE